MNAITDVERFAINEKGEVYLAENGGVVLSEQYDRVVYEMAAEIRHYHWDLKAMTKERDYWKRLARERQKKLDGKS